MICCLLDEKIDLIFDILLVPKRVDTLGFRINNNILLLIFFFVWNQFFTNLLKWSNRELRASQFVVDSLDYDFGGLIKLSLNLFFLIFIFDELFDVSFLDLFMVSPLSHGPLLNIFNRSEVPVFLNRGFYDGLSDLTTFLDLDFLHNFLSGFAFVRSFDFWSINW